MEQNTIKKSLEQNSIPRAAPDILEGINADRWAKNNKTIGVWVGIKKNMFRCYG